MHLKDCWVMMDQGHFTKNTPLNNICTKLDCHLSISKFSEILTGTAQSLDAMLCTLFSKIFFLNSTMFQAREHLKADFTKPFPFTSQNHKATKL